MSFRGFMVQYYMLILSVVPLASSKLVELNGSKKKGLSSKSP